MSPIVMYRSLLREVALDQYGFVTTSDAAEAGVPVVELPKLAARGGLVNVAYGVYRMTDIPATPLDQFAESLLRVGDDARLYGESVLALFGLADVNPRRITVATPRRVRRTLPAHIEVVKVSPEDHVAIHEGLACQPVADAILACRGRIEGSRLVDAARQAHDLGLLTSADRRRVTKEITR